MKTTILMAIFSLLISTNLSAQISGPISVEKKGMKRIYSQNGNTLTSKELMSVLKSSEASLSEFQASKFNSIIGLSSLTVGTVFIGAGFINTVKAAQATNDNDLAASTDYSNKSTAEMLIGAGFYVLSVPFMLMSNSHLKKSINLYNSSGKTGSIRKTDLEIGFTGTSAMIQLRF